MSSRPSSEEQPLQDIFHPLDRLLLRAPLLQPDAWFAVRTLARCRNSERPTPFSFLSQLVPRWAIAGVLGFFLGGFTLQQIQHSQKVHLAKQRNVQEAFEVVASLGADADASSPGQDSSSF